MKDNRVKAALKEGKTVVGTMLAEFRSPEVMRLLRKAGFDFIFIDMEHSTFSFKDVSDLVRVGKLVDLVCLARVTDAKYDLIARTLDSGAQGLMIPRVEDRETVELIVESVKYPPWGSRGYGPRSIITDFEKASVTDMIEWSNKNTLIVIQIEKRKAIDSIEDLMSVKGVDVALIGPQDLSISLGVPGELNHPKMVEAIQKVVDSGRKLDVATGIHVRDIKTLQSWREKGMRMLTYSTEVDMLMSSASAAVMELKK